MAQFIDYTGKKINNWNIISHDGFNKNGESIWTAQCDCENKPTVEKTLTSLKFTPKCPDCVTRERIEKSKKENIGKKFGRLTIIDYYGYRDDTKTKAPYWIAKCDCGSDKDIIATLYDIKRQGEKKSCGCKNNGEANLDLIGKKFGLLTIKSLHSHNKKRTIWLCDCECGNKDIKCNTTALKSGLKKSCGCYEEEIKNITKDKPSKNRKKYNTFIEKDDYYIGVTSKGEFLFDKDDYAKVIGIDRYWFINSYGYVLCCLYDNDFQLHRYLMGLGFYNKENDLIVDHINGNTLDNRKSNLRICKKKENPKNCTLYSNNTSGHKGVVWMERLGKWQVGLQVDKKNLYLGVYSSLEEAVEVRRKAEIKYFGEFSREYRDEVLQIDEIQ